MPKQADLTCAAKCVEDDPKEGISLPPALLQRLGINTKAKKPNTMLALAEMLMIRACVTRGTNISSEELGICKYVHMYICIFVTLQLAPGPRVSVCPPIL